MTAKKPAAPVAKTAAKPAKAAAKLAPVPPAAKKPVAKAAPAKPLGKAAAKAAEELKKKGAKGKPGPVGKKEDVRDEDFVDIEADVEADVEGESEEGEGKAKAKPLRMKVSRAKERALMREFGLDETQLTEEEVAKRRHELKTLIKMGKTRGFLTHQEINDH